MKQTFNYATLADLQSELEKEGLALPISENIKLLSSPIQVCGHTINNRIAIQPMEGCDGTEDGSPDTLTLRRYDRFSKSGAGLIWFEAVAVQKAARANKRQLWLNSDNLDIYKKLVYEMKETSLRETGGEPIIIMQATHSGRYSKPNGVPEPIIAYNNPLFEKDNPIPHERIITDDELKALEIDFVNSASLAEKAGFDGVDIKCCHRYLNSELLSAYNREGEYGGSFENRTRLLRNSIAGVKSAVSKDFIVTTRLNVYDGFPYPYGFGVNKADGVTPDLSEPLKLIDILHNKHEISLIDITIGNPYVNPHVNRPADSTPYECNEHPLLGVSRMMDCIGKVQVAFPNLCVIGSGLSYLRQFSPHLAAGGIEQGLFKLAGFGRQAFAYPQFPQDIFKNGGLTPKNCCIACGKCSQLMRAGTVAGCVIRDSSVYLDYYKQYVK